MSKLPKPDLDSLTLENRKSVLADTFLKLAVQAEMFGPRTGRLTHVPVVVVKSEAPEPAQR